MQPLHALLRHPGQWPRQALIGVVQAYRWTLKPWLGSACRFEPSCSAYALQALHRHGAMRGAALSGWRLVRCHPWCDGGLDPVPEVWRQSRASGLFTDLLKKKNAREPRQTEAARSPPHSHSTLTGDLS